jgi:hypothetical protein
MEDRDAEARNTAVAAIGEDATAAAAELLDGRAAEVDGVVSVARTTRGGGDDVAVTASHQHLGVAGPTVVLGLGGAGVIPGRDEGAVDDPGLPPVLRYRACEASQDRRLGRHDAMDRRLGEASNGGELPEGEVGAEGSAGDRRTTQRGTGEGTAPAPSGRTEHPSQVNHLTRGEAGEQE